MVNVDYTHCFIMIKSKPWYLFCWTQRVYRYIHEWVLLFGCLLIGLACVYFLLTDKDLFAQEFILQAHGASAACTLGNNEQVKYKVSI